METNNTTVTKVCKICNEEKDIKLFTYNNHSKDMHTNICIRSVREQVYITGECNVY